MLSLKNLTLAYRPHTLFSQATLQLYKGQKVGLTGRNGCGKTSLFKLFLGINSPEAGDFSLAPGTLISYIEQEIANTASTVLDYVLTSHPLYISQQTDLPEYYQLKPNAEKLLINLGFTASGLQQPLAEFSGGWQMRANLAKALFSPSDLLLLDEPTNHLDIETVLWLKSWLKHYPGLALIISHDREFLDEVTEHTLHIANQRLSLYGGNYSSFERSLAEKLEHEQKTQASKAAKIAKLQSFVDRFKAKASKAKQAQSRMKMIEKLQFSVTFNSDKDYHLEFLDADDTPDLLVTIENANIGYPDKLLIERINLQIFASDRLGILGQNGKGKTSLIKAIIENNSLLNGTITLSNKIRIGYFAQQTVDNLSSNDTPYALINRVCPEFKRQDILNFLARFGFTDSNAINTISNFSGGEKARLILASIIVQRPNILFLDEPTNHLDMDMREELAAALQNYSGAVILVSHDQFLLNSVVDDFYLINHQRLTKFTGNLDDYHDFLQQQQSEKAAATPVAAQRDKHSKTRAINHLKLQITNCEKQLTKLASTQSSLIQALDDANNHSDFERLSHLHTELENQQQRINAVEELWLELEEQLTQLIREDS